MSPEEFEKMLGATERYNKYHDGIESEINKNKAVIIIVPGSIHRWWFQGKCSQVLLAMQLKEVIEVGKTIYK